MLLFIFAFFSLFFEETNGCYPLIFDYIIVGAGSAGSTVANRLSEDGAVRILLFEAGDDADPSTEIPYLALQTWGSNMDWNYITEPQVNACMGLVQQKSHWPMGKVVGGSSILNFMLYVRGNRRDYTTWAEMTQSPEWGFDQILPYFLKSEDMANYTTVDKKYHGVGGPLKVSMPSYRTPLSYAFEDALHTNGYFTRDYNGQHQTGVSPPQFTIGDGKRCSTDGAFLRPALKRKNLHFFRNARVIKVNMDNTKRAVGVDFKMSRKGLTHKAFATKEVIICAGAVHTPQLLMLSGIGPKIHLQKMNIPVIVDLQGVGQNLQDHVGAGGIILKLNASVSMTPTTVLTLANIIDYQQHQTGPLTVGGGIEGLAFIKTKYANQSEDLPDIEIFAASSYFNFQGTLQKIKAALPFSELENSAYLVPSLLQPKSRGHIELHSSDPYDPPLINPKYLSHEEDLLRLVEGLKLTKKISESDAYKKYGAEIYPLTENLPGCEHATKWSDEYYECLVRTLTYTIFHYCGTCKMGSGEDSVVDSELRVHGTKGLRVVDASIFPVIPSGNTNAPTIMVAEKASDIIKKAKHK